jgi:hypothetical protein
MQPDAIHPYAILICTTLLSVAQSDSYSAFDERLGVAYEFKVHVDSGKEDCFYQQIQPQSSLYVAFQVMRGGDGKAGFAVRDPNGAFVMPYTWKESAEHEVQSIEMGGFYQFCIDNSLSRFASKLVSFYLASFKRDEWENYVDELTKQDVTVANFTTSLQTVDHNIGSMLKNLDQSRRSMSHDWYVVEGNHNYVQNWSICQCVVIVISSVCQVYFVKKLFLESDTGGKFKPRA